MLVKQEPWPCPTLIPNRNELKIHFGLSNLTGKTVKELRRTDKVPENLITKIGR